MLSRFHTDRPGRSSCPRHSGAPRGRHSEAGLTLIECMLAVGIASIISLSTLSAISFARTVNELELERTRAHELVCQALEIERFELFTWTMADTVQTIWDNATPDDSSDDTTGTLSVIVRDPATGVTLTSAPDPAVMVEIEATLSWHPRVGRLSGKTLSESVVSMKVP